MGGSGITVAETTNYKWTLWENWSAPKNIYWLELQRKLDGERVKIRSDGYNYGADASDDEVDKAYKELEKEVELKRNYVEMTKEQITLAEMYARMIDAEHSRDTFFQRMEQAEKLIRILQDYLIKMKKEA
jgi:hypothetical protein